MINKFVCLVATGLALLQLGMAPALAKPRLSVLPSATLVGQGVPVSFQIQISGLHESNPDEIVSAYDLALGFDPTYLTPTGVTFGTNLGGSTDALQDVVLNFDPATIGYTGSFTRAVRITELSFLDNNTLDTIQPDTFTLATLNFDVRTDFQPKVHTTLGIILYAPILDIKGLKLDVPLDVDLKDANIAIPEPGTLVLLVAGLLGYRLMRHRRLIT